MAEEIAKRRRRRERPLVDHRGAPLLEGVLAYQREGIIPFSTPGHKLGIGADRELRETFGDRTFLSDIPLGGGVGDTHFGGEALRVAEAMTADVWDADRSFFLLNGSTAGNHAFMLATIRPGDKVIVSRDLHKSLLVALILTGAVPVYLTPRLHPELNVGLGISVEEVGAALALAAEARPDAIVDLATLTGSAVVGLGPGCTAVLGNDQALTARVLAAAEEAGEAACRLPLLEDRLLVLALPVAGVAAPNAGEGTLSVEDGVGKVTLQARGGVIGRSPHQKLAAATSPPSG